MIDGGDDVYGLSRTKSMTEGQEVLKCCSKGKARVKLSKPKFHMRRASSNLALPSETRQRVGLTLGAVNCDPPTTRSNSARLLASVKLSGRRTKASDYPHSIE